ncbi:polyketide cyclase/dehydrase/lipid transport protein [Actinocorallia herbida]|uniref:Polyketide cyclase/dehydrase/lipid transport protein n=1 Tax=Actinocorallia herbida TaxID=58109 RepID=A0A3N1D942_9ACTN|nr:SRPBCC family protein [Actinocorallia herbida]ROO90062.1 polyketide cyclase/dehydrase/lipid transport protein [Actinocorallia herbida]
MGAETGAEREWVAEESVLIDASPETVFAAVSDPRQVVRWSPEVFRVWVRDEPIEEFSRFVGFNRRGPFVWFTNCEVTVHDPERVFAFRVMSFGMEVALWGYRLEPVGSGTRLTEYWQDLRRGSRTAPLVSLLGRVFTGTPPARRAALNRAGMRTTLTGIKAALETPADRPST